MFTGLHRFALLLCIVLTGCACESAASGAMPSTLPTEPEAAVTQELDAKPAAERFTGILRGGILAGGAETTGWVLEQEGNVRIDVNVSKIQEEVAALDGKRVVIEGKLTTVNWPERGKKKLLMASSISAVADDAK